MNPSFFCSGPGICFRKSHVVVLLIFLVVTAGNSSGQKKIPCPDGDHYLIDWKEIAIQYNATSVVATLQGLGLMGGQVAVTPQQLQQVTETTQQWDEYLKGLVAGYNACVITKQEYQEGINRIIARLKQNANELENDRKNLSQGKSVDPTRLQESLRQYSTELSRFIAFSGVLTPARDPDPPIPASCGKNPPPNALKAFLGDSLGWTTGDKFVILKVAGQNIVSVGRTGDGQLTVSAKVFSVDGKIVAQVVNNRFNVNPNNHFRLERPDAHTLVVYDLTGQKVLDLRYLNRWAVKLTGEFRGPGSAPLSIGDAELKIGSFGLPGACFINVDTVINMK